MDTKHVTYLALEMVLSNESFSAEKRAQVAAHIAKTLGSDAELSVLEMVLSNEKYSSQQRLEGVFELVRHNTPTKGVPVDGAPVNAPNKPGRARGMTRSQEILQVVHELGGQADTNDLANRLEISKGNLSNYLTSLVNNGDLVRVARGKYQTAPTSPVVDAGGCWQANENDDWETINDGPELSASV